MSHKQITSFQRNELSAFLRAELKQKNIAELLNKTPSAICQELKRNKADIITGYSAKIAKENIRERRVEANKRFRKIDNNEWIKKYIIKKVKKYWSPEQIAGRLKSKYPNEKEKHISKDSIYKFIYEEKKDLVKYLRCQKGKYRRRYSTRISRKQREEQKKKRIEKRSAEAEEKIRIGDQEGNTMIGIDGGHILTHVDRYSGYGLGDKLKRGLAELTRKKTEGRFNKLPKNKKYTITYDNGPTFAEHESTERRIKVEIFFANPYHSRERGCNENFNGLPR